jgi:hypothetical protein
MKHQEKILSYLFIFVLFVSVIIIPIGKSCKDIVITPAATSGNYSLLLKVRDPSREGLQVLCRVPHGTQYTYHYPWIGRPWGFTVDHTFFGVATQGDTFPNIVKAGMVFTDAGLAFGDADTLSNWKNPTKNAWDDFDWMRYAYQTSDNEDEAITLLTTDAIDHLHATGVPENLFVVGPNKAVVIEADAVHYTVKEISDILIMSNYPKNLWRTQLLITLPIASAFDTVRETWVRHGNVVHLGSLCGVKIVQVNQTSVTVKAVPMFIFRLYGIDGEVPIQLGERGTVGPYSVTLLDINDTSVKISVSTADYAWEQELLARIRPKTGHITLEDMMSWSRLHSSDLDGLRPLCEDANTYESAMIYKIPQEYANLLSNGWFAANHPCASIYVPVHICDNDLYDLYQTGVAAALSLELLHQYGHGTLTPLCQSVETVFLAENEINELIARQMLQNGTNITAFLTTMDRGMQEQAFLTEQLWLYTPNASQGIVENIWMNNYTMSLERMQRAVSFLKNISGSETVISLIGQIALSICKTKSDRAAIKEKMCMDVEQGYTTAERHFKSRDYFLDLPFFNSSFLSVLYPLKE